MRHFKVKIGYGKDDFISIDETELQKAIKAQITGMVAVFSEGSVAGNHIIAITPDFNLALGVNRDYQLTGEDYALLGKQIINEHRELLEQTKTQVYQLTSKQEVKQIE